MSGMPEYSKDAITAVLGAAVGLAGLLLVVVGYVFAQKAAFGSAADDTLLKRYETAGQLGLVPFLVALADAGLCTWWLIHSSKCVFSTAVAGFFLLLFLTAVYGSVLILRYL
jgi:hypothetical protein